jgi:DNA-binding phage protein
VRCAARAQQSRLAPSNGIVWTKLDPRARLRTNDRGIVTPRTRLSDEHELAPQPERVFSADDLVRQLDRLRRAAAAGTAQRRVGLDRLARATGIPRSTLHTYLSGATFPPASAVDRIVIALGCEPPQVRAWASAWDRVADAAHGSRARRGVSPNSKLLSFCGDVRDQLDRPTDRAYDLLEPVALFERVHIGPTRAIAALDVRATVRAVGGRADRYAIRIGPNPAIDIARLDLTNLVNCRPGRQRTLTEPRVRVLEALFDHALEPGETYTFEFRVDYAAAAIRGAPPRVSTETLRAFLRRGPLFTMETRFPEGDPPAALRQVHLAHVAAEENVVRPLTVNEWGAAHVVVEHPVAGLHGMRWTWP